MTFGDVLVRLGKLVRFSPHQIMISFLFYLKLVLDSSTATNRILCACGACATIYTDKLDQLSTVDVCWVTFREEPENDTSIEKLGESVAGESGKTFYSIRIS